MDSIDDKPVTHSNCEIATQAMGDIAITCSLSQKQANLTKRVETLSSIANAIRLSSIPGIRDIVVSPDRVTVVYDPLLIDCFATLEAKIHIALTHLQPPSTSGKLHDVPVWYGGDTGPDFDAVCRSHAIDGKTLIQLHTEPEYLVTAIGFVPGFPYLEGLPETLETPRLSTPRRRVPAGSVGIGGSQTGVYPFDTPGGWHLIGKTDTNLFNPINDPPALLQSGDRVRFHETDSVNMAPDPTASIAPECVTQTNITILQPGLMTTVQDLGRSGFRSSGVPSGGVADRVSAMLANSILGNPENAALLEYTILGPTLQFQTDTVIALTGAADDSLATLRPLRVRRGDTLHLGHAAKGCRGYLAVAGGICVPAILNSYSTYAPAKLGGYGGRPLQTGDQLAIGNPLVTSFSTTWSLNHDVVPLPANPCTLKILPEGPLSNAHHAIINKPMHVTAQSDRMGIRFRETLPPLSATPLSRAVLPGTIQLPPDGRPILLLCDAQTIGGYPVLGHLIAADLPRAAQLRPGDTVCFSETTLAEAHRLLRHQHNMLATIQQGINHTLGLAEKAE
jgi:KipI family sensor histidine kinase inhibitor